MGDETVIKVQVWQILVVAAVLLAAAGGGLVLVGRHANHPAPAPVVVPANATAQANVRMAIPAAEIYWQQHGSYAGITTAALQTATTGVSPHVSAYGLNHGKGYCLDDQEPGGARYYYVGGDGGAQSRPVHTVAPGRCIA